MVQTSSSGLIDKILYDLDTIRYLRSFSRLKETLPFAKKIFLAIDQLNPHFWQMEFQPGVKMSHLRSRIEDLSQSPDNDVDADLRSLEYERFLQVMSEWIGQEIFQFRQANKTTRQKRFESLTSILAWTTIGVCAVVVLILNSFFSGWGLTANFYRGMNFDEFLVSTTHKTINFIHYLQMDPRIPAENFSARWYGDLVVPSDGHYEFLVVVDDGVRLFIDNKILIDEWSDHSNGKFEKEIFLTKGRHKIRVDFFNHLFGASLELLWKKPGHKKAEIIPSWYLRTESVL